MSGLPNAKSVFKEDEFANISLITLNVAQIPFSPLLEERAQKTVDFLSAQQDSDILILQECFKPSFIHKLKSTPDLTEKYQIIEPRGLAKTLYNSGVCVLVDKRRFEVIDVVQPVYAFGTSVDYFCPKGFSHLKLKDRQSQQITHLVGTHTQAQYVGSEHQVIATLSQLASLGEYVKCLSENEACVVAGDLNIPRQAANNTIEFQILQKLLYPLLAHTSEKPSFSEQNSLNRGIQEPSGSLDHVFSRGMGNEKSSVIESATYQVGTETRDISDHYPVQVSLKNQVKEQEYLDDTQKQLDKQQRILGQLLRLVFINASQYSAFGWELQKAGELYNSACQLVSYYDDLSLEQKLEKGVGEEFLEDCLNHQMANQPELEQLYMADTPVKALSSLLRVKPTLENMAALTNQSANLNENLSWLAYHLTKEDVALSAIMLTCMTLALVTAFTPAFIYCTVGAGLVGGVYKISTVGANGDFFQERVNACKDTSATKSPTVVSV